MRKAGSLLAVLVWNVCFAISGQLLLGSATAIAQSGNASCPVELVEAHWKPQPRNNSSNLGQLAFLDLKYVNRSPDRIQEITISFKSTFVTHGAMGTSVSPSERTLVVESSAGPGKAGHAELDIGPSNPGRGVVRLQSIVFASGMKWASDQGNGCVIQVH